MNKRGAIHVLCWKMLFEGCGTLRYETILSILVSGDFLPPVARQDISRLNVVVAVSVVWNWAEATSSKCSWLGCFVPHQSAIVMFAYVQMNRAKGERPPFFGKSLINPGVKAVWKNCPFPSCSFSKVWFQRTVALLDLFALTEQRQAKLLFCGWRRTEQAINILLDNGAESYGPPITGLYCFLQRCCI